MKPEYNSERPKLIIPEYGRNIQKMVDYAASIKDTEERNKVAQSIITVMGQLNPHLRDVNDFKHKLWDHLFIISDYKLEVDSPYPIPKPEDMTPKPDKVRYPYKDIKFRYYGKLIEMLIKKAITYEDGELKEVLIRLIANHMKKLYLNWNKSTVTDEVILKDFEKLSDGKLNVTNLQLSHSSELISKRKRSPSSSSNGHHHSSKPYKPRRKQ